MKKYQLALAGVFVVAAVDGGLWAQDNAPTPATNSALEERWQRNPVGEYQTAQAEAFRARPDLEMEYKDLALEKDKVYDDLEAAMIKAEPSLEPLLERSALQRKRETAEIEGTPVPAEYSVPPLPPDFKMTPEISKKGLAANQAAFSDPDLRQRFTALSRKMVAFHHKLDAVIIEEHPEYAPMIAKMRSPHNAKAAPASTSDEAQ
jgi:hypothetical protein